MIFNRLSWFEAQALMFWIRPFLAGLLGSEILDSYWTDEISFRTIPLCLSLALYNAGVSLTSFFPKQNMNLWPCRPWAKEIPLEPPNPSAILEFGLPVVGWAVTTISGWMDRYTTASRVEGQGKLSETLGASYIAVCASSPLSEVHSLSVASFFKTVLECSWFTMLC